MVKESIVGHQTTGKKKLPLLLGEFLILVYFFWAYMPVMQGYFGFFVNRTYAILFICVFMAGMALVCMEGYNKIHVNGLLLISSMFVLFHIVFFVSGFVDSLGHLYRTVLYWSTFFYMALIYKDIYRVKRVFKFVLVLMFVTIITSYSALLMNPSIARTLTGTTADSIDTNIVIYRANVAGVQFFQMLILLVPVILFMSHKAKKLSQKLLCVGVVVALGGLLIQASFTIALIIYALAIVSSFVYMKNAKKGLIVAALLLLVLTAVPWSGVFSFLASNIDSRHISIRLNELSVFFSSGQFVGDFAGRWQLYSRSINTFINHPFGIGPYYKNIIIDGDFGIGYHSQILDDLARYGVFTIPCYLIFFFSYYKLLKAQWNKVGTPSMAIIIVSLYVIMLMVNLGTTSIYESVMLFIILPTIPEMILLRKNKEVAVS